MCANERKIDHFFPIHWVLLFFFLRNHHTISLNLFTAGSSRFVSKFEEFFFYFKLTCFQNLYFFVLQRNWLGTYYSHFTYYFFYALWSPPFSFLILVCLFCVNIDSINFFLCVLFFSWGRLFFFNVLTIRYSFFHYFFYYSFSLFFL